MKKRPSRPARFAAVDNGAIDALPSILSVGLLTRLIRAQDGADVTVEMLTKEYAEGEASLTKAMRALVDAAFVVKFKVQRATTEKIEEAATGEQRSKRGGSWYTTFCVDSIPFTHDDVAALLQEIQSGGNARAVRVEPAYLDPRRIHDADPPPAPVNTGAGPTAENNNNSSPAPAFPGAGQPTPGQPASGRARAHKKRKTMEGKTPSIRPSVTPDSPPWTNALTQDTEPPHQQRDTTAPARHEPSPADRNSSEPMPTTSVDSTPGVDVLLAIGREKPDFLVSGATLRDQGRTVTALLDAGWTPGQLRHIVAGQPLPHPIKKSVGAVIAKRLRDAAASPSPNSAPAIPAEGTAQYPEAETATVLPDSIAVVREQLDAAVHGTGRFRDCDGDDGLCPSLALPGEAMCRKHLQRSEPPRRTAADPASDSQPRPWAQ